MIRHALYPTTDTITKYPNPFVFAPRLQYWMTALELWLLLWLLPTRLATLSQGSPSQARQQNQIDIAKWSLGPNWFGSTMAETQMGWSPMPRFQMAGSPLHGRFPNGPGPKLSLILI